MNPSERSHLNVTALTHPGMKGKDNEDRYAVSAYRLSSKDPTPSVLAVICDGIGGHRAGEVAAEMAVESISRTIAKSDAADPRAILERALVEASQQISRQSEANPDQKGMGATCVCAWIIGDRLYTTSVGDSRLYLIRREAIAQLTTDHTWIQEALEYGALTPEQARNHPNAHVIRRYLGSQKQVVPDFRLRLRPDETDDQAEANQGMHLLPGDILVLCSDGLTDLVNKQEIYDTVKNQDLKQALKSLVDLANQRGGHDNITVVALEMPVQPTLQAAPTVVAKPTKKRLPLSTVWVALISLAVVAVGLVAVISAALVWYFTRPSATPTVTRTVAPQTSPRPTSTSTFTPTLTAVKPSQTVTPTSSKTLTPTATASSSPTHTPPTGTPTATVLPLPSISAVTSAVLIPTPSITLTLLPGH